MSKTIDSEDLSLAKVFQSFYRVLDYQREYVWGETGSNGDGGDQVDQFLHDIHSEFDAATEHDAPEYFIGTIVVWEPEDGLYNLIDGQQRTTTSFFSFTRTLGLDCSNRPMKRFSRCSSRRRASASHGSGLSLQPISA